MIFVTFSSKTDIFYYRDTVVSCLVLLFGSLFQNIQMFGISALKTDIND